MKTTPTLFVTLGLTLLAPMVQAQAAPPAAPKAPGVQTPAATDPAVQPLLDSVAAAYRNVNALSFKVETTQTNPVTQAASTIKSTVAFKKPNKLTATVEMDKDIIHVVSDGAAVFADSSTEKTSYLKQPFTSFKDMIGTLAESRGAGIGLLPILLTSPNAEKQIIPGTPSSLKKLADDKVGDDACDQVEAVVPVGGAASRFLFFFGKQDHLLRRLSYGPATDAKPVIVETYTSVNLAPAETDTTFKYTPAPGAKPAAPPKEQDDGPMFDPRLKVGALPLPFKGTDLDGKEVSLAQYKGKVLLLDFWATWCGPCVAELPNVVAAYGKYHAKGFEIVGVSLDQPNSKAQVLKFTKENKMPWRQIYDGKYWSSANAVSFKIQAIPFTLLIGKDGKIAAVGARGEALAPAIEAALKK